MSIGNVKWYDFKRGFGFIIDPIGFDVFVHYSSIEGQGFRRVFKGETVEYQAELGPRGYYAVRVRRLTPDPPARGDRAASDGDSTSELLP